MSHKFTHAADAAARIVIQNALFGSISKKAKLSSLVIPWATYTSPEIAHVGLSQSEATATGQKIDTYKIELDKVDRAITDGETSGFVKVHTEAGSDKILGATIVSKNAGDIISNISLAMTNNLGLGAIAKTIHPYPTQAEMLKRAADAYNRTRLTPLVGKFLAGFLKFVR